MARQFKKKSEGLLFLNCLFDCYSDWVCTAVMSNDVMKDLRG